MITIKIIIRDGKDKVGVAVHMKGMKTASPDELEEFAAIHDKIMSRRDDLAQEGVDGFLTLSATGKVASNMLLQRIKNL